jgi:hypothetical protein
MRKFALHYPLLAAALFLGAVLLLAWAVGLHLPADVGLIAMGFGTIMSPSTARVVDPVLSTVAQGYQNAEMVSRNLFPVVPVGQRGGRVLTFGKEDFRLYNTLRAPGSATKRIQFGYLGNPYSLEDHSLEGVVPIETEQEAQAVPGIDLGSGAVKKIQNIIQLRAEYAASVLARNTANFAGGNNVTLSGTSQFSDYTNSDPSVAIETGKEAIRASTGKRPNTIVMGPKVMAQLRYHTKLLDRIKYTGRDSVTEDLLAMLWGVKKVYVGDAIYYDDVAGGFVDVWGKDIVMAYTETGSLADNGAPTFGYTYRLSGYPIVEMPYQDRNAKSWVYPVDDALMPVVASNVAGYLIKNAVA